MLAQKLILSYSSRLVIQFIQMVVGVIVARIVGPSVIGTVAFGLSYVSMFLFLTDMGTSTAHIKLIADGENEGNVITTFAHIKISLILLFTLVVLTVFGVQRVILHHSFESSDYDLVIILSLVTAFVGQFFQIPQATFIAHVEQAKQDIPDMLNNIMHQVFRLIVVFLGYKAVALVSARLLATLIIIPFYFFLFRHYPRGKFDKQLAKKFFSISLPVVVILFSQSIMYWSDKVILQFLTDSKEVGYYAASFGFTNFITLIQSSTGTIFFPTFVKNIIDNDYEAINNRINKYERFNFIYIFPLVVLLAIYSDLIIRLILGKLYLATIPIFSITITAVFIPIMNLPYGNIILGKGLFKLSAKIFFSVMLFFVAAAFGMASPSILNLGGVGIAFALLLTNIFLGVLILIFIKEKAPVIKIFQSKNVMFYGLLYSVIFYFVYNQFSHSLQLAFISALIYFVGYWGGLILLRLANRDDLFFVTEILNIKKLKNYIRDEINLKKK